MGREGRRNRIAGGWIVCWFNGSVLKRPGRRWIFQCLPHIKVDRVDLLVREDAVVGESTTIIPERANCHPVRGLQRRRRSTLNLRGYKACAVTAVAALDRDAGQTARTAPAASPAATADADARACTQAGTSS